jgi:hypothetical protein
MKKIAYTAILIFNFLSQIKKIKNFLILVFFINCLFIGSTAFSQNAADYVFSYSSGAYSEITGAACTAAQGDDTYSTGYSIGFTFNYCGSNYTTFNAAANGHIYFGSSSSNSNDLASTTYKSIIAPLWDDLYSSNIQYLMEGLSPNRILTVQWKNSKWYYSGTAGQNFQVKLYETTNIIKFVYGGMVTPTSASASIGINDATGGSGHFICVTPATTPTSSSATANNSINAITFLGSGLTYTFSPPTCYKPSAVSSSSVASTTATIFWTAASPLPGSGYQYEVRTSGGAGSGSPGLAVSGSTTAGVVSANISGLSPLTVYYVYVRSYCGGSDYSAWTSSYSFTTACGSITSLPWSQNFDGMGSIGNSIIPSCWKIESGNGTPWYSGNAGSITCNDPSSSPNYIYCNYLPTSTDKYLITPGFSLTAGTSYDFKFKYAGDGYSGWTGNVRYNTSQTGSGSTFYGNFLSSTTTTSSSYTEVTNTFVPSSTAPYYFIIQVNNSSSPFYYLGFDDFSLSLSPTSTVQVNATVGPGSSVGYPTLKTAFDAINAGTHQGDVTVAVGNTSNQIITETIQAKLNKSGTGASNYTSVIVRPGASNITITSTLGASLSTVYLNEAQNVTFDGRIGSAVSTVDLTIENTSTQATYGAIYMNGTQSNTIKYCNLKSSTSHTCGYGTITMFASSAYGCSNNNIENCNITKAGTTMPMVAIGSRAISSSFKNTGNVIKNNSISDFQRVGVWAGSYTGTTGYNETWTIEGNTFYQSASINLGSSYNNGINTYDNYAILIGHTVVGSLVPAYNESGYFTIKNNTIGGNGAGGNWTATGSSTSNKVIPIYVACSNASYSEIYGNTISNFNVETQNFLGICAYYSKVKIGSSGVNTVSNIALNHPAANGGSASGIYVYTSSDYANEIKNNSITNISATSGNKYSNFYGVYNFCSATHPKDIVLKNAVSNIDASNADVAYGFYVQGYVAQNHVSKIKFSGANPLYGIWWGGGRATGLDYRVENNEVNLGFDNSGSSTAVNSDVYGIYSNRSEINLFYNSVLLQGVATTKNSYCMRLNSNATGYVVKNNLLYNERSGGSGNNYCISTAFTTTSFWSSSNNAYVLYSGSKAAYYLGDWGGTGKATLSDWTSASSETNSISETTTNKPVTNLLPNVSGSDNLLPFNDKWLCAGTIVNPTTDFTGLAANNRHNPAPTTIGAYELDCPIILPIELLKFACISVENKNVLLQWITASEINNDFFTIERSSDGKTFKEIIVISGAGNSNAELSYQTIDTDPYPGINYYRLKQTDYDGTSSYSQIISTDISNQDFNISIFPNPFSEYLEINFNDKEASDITVSLINEIGQEISVESMKIDINKIRLTFPKEIPQGYYFIKVTNHNQCRYYKTIKIKSIY